MGKMYRQVADLNRDYLKRGGRREALERTVTFSIRLTESQNAKLKYLAGRFGEAKSPLAQQLLDAAMEESLTNVASHDTDDETAGKSPEESNQIIAAKIEEYRDEIQRIFAEDTKS
jgi:predicted DNA-binding protein